MPSSRLKFLAISAQALSDSWYHLYLQDLVPACLETLRLRGLDGNALWGTWGNKGLLTPFADTGTSDPHIVHACATLRYVVRGFLMDLPYGQWSFAPSKTWKLCVASRLSTYTS